MLSYCKKVVTCSGALVEGLKMLDIVVKGHDEVYLWLLETSVYSFSLMA